MSLSFRKHTSMRKLQWLVFAMVILLRPANAQSADTKIAILHGTELLDQCSRQSPTADGTWNPTLADVERLEALLPSALAKAPQARDLDALRVLSEWTRQYAGLLRGGKRYLYGSFFNVGANSDLLFPEWRIKPLIVCDGGSSVFGIELDVEQRTISHLSFNGHG